MSDEQTSLTMNEEARRTRPPPHHKKLSLNIKKAREPERNVKHNHIVEVRSLLSELVNTTAAVLTSGPVHVWQVYGGFQRIYEAVLHIFYHGCIHRDAQGHPDIWPFIVGLRVLSPVLGPSDVATKPRPGDRWIHTSLQKLQLAAKIAALTDEREYLEKHYHPWALFRSLAHVNAVKTCLKALEENSQDGLADIDPKLLVGEYYPPPGSSVVNRHEISNNMSILKGDVYSLGLSNVALVDAPVPPYRSVLSLPTSPVSEKDWIPDWPRGNPGRTGEPINHRNRVGTEVVKCHSHPLVRRGRSEVTLKSSIKNIAHQSTRPLGGTDIAEQNPALMRRESPDGSSGSTEWPLTSPVSRPVSFVSKESPQLSSTSSSPIARLVQGEIVSVCKTGARPKEYRSTSQTRSHAVSHFHLDVSNSSEALSSISPSLLQVNYGGKHSTSEGEASSSQGMGRNGGGGGGGMDIRTPQLRRRASSGRLGSLHTESDCDSEDTIDGKASQGSRRRRRNTTSQNRSSLSVKMLVDSRGVLGSETNKLTCVVRNLTDDQNSSCIDGELNIDKQIQISTVSNFPSSKLEKPTTLKTSASMNISKPSEPGNKSTGASLGVEISGSMVGTMASSAPGTMMKPSEIPYVSEVPKMKKKTHSRSRSDGSQEIASKLKLATSNTAPTLETSSNLSDEMSYASHIRKRFMDDGGHSITLAADYGVSPRPLPGQSLINFLSSKDKPHAELDRENAHFNISEAVIAALTQMQFNIWLGKTVPTSVVGEESDEEIRILEARIREKRRLKRNASGTGHSGLAPNPISEPRVLVRSPSIKVESTTDYSMYESPQSSAYNSESEPLTELEEEVEEKEHVDTTRVAPVSLSRKMSNADQPITSDLTSAESVAINLLKRFSEQKLPKASELEWLVSEQDVPQKLLPLPTSVAVSPDDGSGMDKENELHMQLRGTMDWAPPRPQLILSLHTNTKRSLLMGMQRWRCAGCGMRVSESLSRHFRLCHYLGRFFCTTCHKNQSAIIPAKILHKWDFKPYPVASFSYELIERMKIDPLINVGALNPRLYKKCRHLHQTHIFRLQLYHTLPYINTCRRAQGEKMTLGKLPLHWASDPHVYSLDDLEAIKTGQVIGSIKDVALLCIRHIAKCEVCLGRGFICEICCRGEAIFPFQLDSTSLCEICNACFHAGCFSPPRCPRCIRRETRRLSHDVMQDAGSNESSVRQGS